MYNFFLFSYEVIENKIERSCYLICLTKILPLTNTINNKYDTCSRGSTCLETILRICKNAKVN